MPTALPSATTGRSRLEDALKEALFLIPVMTPSYFASPQCRAEAETFIDLEKQSGRHTKILPIYLIEAEIFEGATRQGGDPLARILRERQYVDWREHKFQLSDQPHIKERVFDMARQIRGGVRSAACRRTAKRFPLLDQ